MSVTESTEDFGPETIVDLLSNQPATVGGYGFNYSRSYGTGSADTWTNAEPEVYHWEDVAQTNKENNNDPALYVWSPVDITSERFSADGDTKIDQEVVEIQCWTLDRTESRQYAKDASRILEIYLEDNERNTNWHWIDPESLNDARAEKIARRTDHYIVTVQGRLQKVRPTGP